MKTLLTLVKLFFVAMAVAAVGAAMPAEYEVRHEQHQCLHNEKRVSGARFCHNCRKTGGNKIQWRFRVYCEGQFTQKSITVPRTCGKSIAKEGIQSREMYEAAKEIMDDHLQSFAGWRDCNLGGWKK